MLSMQCDQELQISFLGNWYQEDSECVAVRNVFHCARRNKFSTILAHQIGRSLQLNNKHGITNSKQVNILRPALQYTPNHIFRLPPLLPPLLLSPLLLRRPLPSRLPDRQHIHPLRLSILIRIPLREHFSDGLDGDGARRVVVCDAGAFEGLAQDPGAGAGAGGVVGVVVYAALDLCFGYVSDVGRVVEVDEVGVLL